jgi:phosphoribosylamine--glycine ligase
VTVVVAAEGYPAAPRRGDEIGGLAEAAAEPGAYVLHAGTSQAGAGPLLSAGGRVLNVVGTGADIAAARGAAYRAAARITMPGGWYRRDIAAPMAPARS